MEVTSKANFVRVATRKLGLMAREIRGKDINEALNYLKMSPRKRAAGVFHGLLKSAVANADTKGTVDVDTLYIKTLLVNQGPGMKRYNPRAKGAAHQIDKRASHVTVTLAER